VIKDEQRHDERAKVWLPIRLTSDEGEVPAVSADASEMGALVLAPRALAVGSRVTLSFDIPGNPPTVRTTMGEVVRSESNVEDPHGLWPYRLAVTFDSPVPELDAEALAPLSRR